MKNAIKQTTTLSKNYKYEKNNITLSFTLNVKSKFELKTWVELMDKAAVDVNEDIKNLEPKI